MEIYNEKTKLWTTDKCLSRLCKRHICNAGFVWPCSKEIKHNFPTVILSSFSNILLIVLFNIFLYYMAFSYYVTFDLVFLYCNFFSINYPFNTCIKYWCAGTSNPYFSLWVNYIYSTDRNNDVNGSRLAEQGL